MSNLGRAVSAWGARAASRVRAGRAVVRDDLSRDGVVVMGTSRVVGDADIRGEEISIEWCWFDRCGRGPAGCAHWHPSNFHADTRSSCRLHISRTSKESYADGITVSGV